MKTIQGAQLGKELRALSDRARSRAWIVSPYIGRWPAITALLGGNWWRGIQPELKVITDVSEPRNVNRGTLLRFIDRGFVKNIPGVHAKIYIFDDQAIVTSANLTETAFTKRREIGLLLNEEESKETIRIFEVWWQLAAELTPQQFASIEQATKGESSPEPDGEALKSLWSLPDQPESRNFASTKETEKASNYRQFLANYGEIAAIYSEVQRLWDAPLFLEVDAFLNFLFHDAHDRPSFAFWGADRAKNNMTDASRRSEIARRAPEFERWSIDHPEERADRVERLITVQKLLKKERIRDLGWSEIRSVANCLHAMGARQLNKHKFLNPQNNELETICDAWAKLLFSEGTEDERIRACDERLRFFGPSSIQELLGCYYPEQYPLRNSNSDSGLKFFGFDV